MSRVQGVEDAEALEVFSARYQQNLKLSGYAQFELGSLAPQDIRKLFLSSNKVSEVHIKTAFMNLEHLELVSSGLGSLPANFGILVPNLRSLSLGSNSLKDLTPLLGLKKLKSLALPGNRLARLRKAVNVLQKLPELERLDFRDNPFTIGFYDPLAQNKLLRREDVELSRERQPFGLAAADIDADIRYRAILDEATQLRRRVYELLVATHCPRLQYLDGLPFRKKDTMAKDSSWARLMELGVIKASKANARVC